MSKQQFSKLEFQGLASCLVQLTNIRYTASGKAITEEQFLEGMAGSDPELAARIRSWLEAGRAMAGHITARSNDSASLKEGLPLSVNPGGHAL